jgi:hypothetical protein
MMQVVARVATLEPVIASQYGGSNATHVPSYRYMFVDRFSQKAQASPPGKVSAQAAYHAHMCLEDLEKGRLENPTAQAGWFLLRGSSGDLQGTVVEGGYDGNFLPF